MAHSRLMRSPQAHIILPALSDSNSDEDSVKSTEVECEPSIFEKVDKDSDVTFMVEDKEIHFCKAFLSASSPVFERMFASDFKEKESGVVRLPGKTVKDVDIFLQQLHPVHCWKDLSDDQLATVLHLADEYQVEHIPLKCQKYIERQLENNATPPAKQGSQHNENILSYHYPQPKVPELPCTRLSLDTQLLYLGLCDQYSLSQAAREQLICLMTGKSVKSLESNPNYGLLPLAAQKDLFKARCVWLEKRSGQC